MAYSVGGRGGGIGGERKTLLLLGWRLECKEAAGGGCLSEDCTDSAMSSG